MIIIAIREVGSCISAWPQTELAFALRLRRACVAIVTDPDPNTDPRKIHYLNSPNHGKLQW